MKRLIAAFLAAFVLLLPTMAAAIDIKQITTPLGIKAWLVEDKSTPVIALSFSFVGGTASDPAGFSGATDLMANLLTDGAGTLGAQAFRQRQEDAAASLGFSASLDRMNGSLRVLSANRDEGFELLRLAMVEPRFEPTMLEQRRAQTIASLNQAAQRPASVAGRTLMTTLFAGHPYAADPEGTREDLTKVTADLLKKRAAAVLLRNGVTIAAVGDITEAELARQIDRTFGSLPVGTSPALPPQWEPPTKPRTVVVERPVPQSAMLMALPGIARDDPDWYAALVMNHVLGGGGQQSRLFNEVREKRGLAYSVSSGLRTYKRAALLVVQTGSANERVAEAIRVIKAEMVRLRNDGVTDQELTDAKTYLSGALALSLDSSSAIAALLHSMQIDGLSPDHLTRRAALIAAVKLEDVRKVARRLLRDEALTTVVVGKPVGIASDP